MKPNHKNIQIISSPSILGLRPTGVEGLADSLLKSGLASTLNVENPAIYVPTLNFRYNSIRNTDTFCLNTKNIRSFSIVLEKHIMEMKKKEMFSLVLGGDCSILIGIMSGLKQMGEYGLIFLDAHADFYAPEQSISGEVADMDLQIVTGGKPDELSNIHQLKPYVKPLNTIHIGQRDWEETQKYGADDIKNTEITCFDWRDIMENGIEDITANVLSGMKKLEVKGFWIHYDTDVLDDEINPAVDYRLPGGLGYFQIEYLIKKLLITGKIAGISVTIYNPKLDPNGLISRQLTESLGRIFN